MARERGEGRRGREEGGKGLGEGEEESREGEEEGGVEGLVAVIVILVISVRFGLLL